MTIWMRYCRTHKGSLCHELARVQVEGGKVLDAGAFLDRFVGGSWEWMRREVEKAGWSVEQ